MDHFRIISLVIALLVAQFSYAGHHHPVDEHHSAADCFLCTHGSILDHVATNDYQVLTSKPLSERLDIAVNGLLQPIRNKAFYSRAPPQQ